MTNPGEVQLFAVVQSDTMGGEVKVWIFKHQDEAAAFAQKRWQKFIEEEEKDSYDVSKTFTGFDKQTGGTIGYIDGEKTFFDIIEVEDANM